MKAITICQPYAELICLPESDRRHKRVENRDWPTRYRGPLLIHAGKNLSWLTIEPGDDGKPWDANYEIPMASMQFGAVVATSNLIDCLHIDRIEAGQYNKQYPWLREHQHASGEWCFILADVERLPRPIPWRGAQGLFDIEWPVAA